MKQIEKVKIEADGEQTSTPEQVAARKKQMAFLEVKIQGAWSSKDLPEVVRLSGLYLFSAREYKKSYGEDYHFGK